MPHRGARALSTYASHRLQGRWVSFVLLSTLTQGRTSGGSLAWVAHNQSGLPPGCSVMRWRRGGRILRIATSACLRAEVCELDFHMVAPAIGPGPRHVGGPSALATCEREAD